jgi:hypothetical protein
MQHGGRMQRAGDSGGRSRGRNLSVQVRNPDGTSRNSVSLVVAAPNVSDDVVVLLNAAPVATGKDIVVVEPTIAGVSVPGNDVDLNLAALGSFSATNNSCSLTENPVPLQRPASGAAAADICLFSESGLDTSMTSAFRDRAISPCFRSSPWGLASCV